MSNDSQSAARVILLSADLLFSSHASAAVDRLGGKLTVAADTVKTPERGRAPLIAVMLTLVIASVIALLVVRGQGQKQQRGAEPPAAPAEQPADTSAVADRNQLDDLLRSGHREPLAPTTCRTTSPDALASLKDVAENLRGGAPGGARPGDRRALELLATAGAPSGPAAEYWHLLAKARLYVGEAPSSVLTAAGNALEQCPEYAAAHQVAGTASFLADRNADAQRYFSRAIELAPTFSRIKMRNCSAVFFSSPLIFRSPPDPPAVNICSVARSNFRSIGSLLVSTCWIRLNGIAVTDCQTTPERKIMSLSRTA